MTTQQQQDNGKQKREEMKSISFGIVSNISQIIANKGFGDRAIDIVEALAFAMFIIADTYSLARPDKEQAIETIHAFYDDMRDHLINKILDRHLVAPDAGEMEAAAAKFHCLSRDRYREYGAKFKEDIADPLAMSCPATVSFLLDNLFIQPLAQEEKLQLMPAVSDRILYLWSGCAQSFK